MVRSPNSKWLFALAGLLRASDKMAGDWLILRSLRSKMCLSPSLKAILLGALCLSTASCGSGPRRYKAPSIDASSAGKTALETYDKNGDGLIAGDELEHAPALKAALPRLDTDHDNGVSAVEVAERVNAWKAMKTGSASVRAHVTLDGQPLVGAQLVLEPESFLGEEVKTATGTTNQFGDVAPTIAKEDRPDPTLPGGAHFGLYKVRISKPVNGKETIPARYNTGTTLGQEVSYDDPGILNNNLAYALKSGG